MTTTEQQQVQAEILNRISSFKVHFKTIKEESNDEQIVFEISIEDNIRQMLKAYCVEAECTEFSVNGKVKMRYLVKSILYSSLSMYVQQRVGRANQSIPSFRDCLFSKELIDTGKERYTLNDIRLVAQIIKGVNQTIHEFIEFKHYEYLDTTLNFKVSGRQV